MKTLTRIACLATFAFSAVAAQAETYAVMIGICDYPEVVVDGKTESMDLSGPVNDVKTYKDLLVNKYGVKPDNVKLILDKEASKDGFLKGIGWLLDNAKAGDQIFFVYSGHGTQIKAEDEPDGKEECIVLADDTLVPGDLFKELTDMTAKAGINATLVFDSCFSGGMSRDVASFDGKAATQKRKFVMEKATAKMKKLPMASVNTLKAAARSKAAAAGGSYAFLFAGKEDQPTTDLDFKDKDTPDHGLFTLVLAVAMEKLPEAGIEDVIKAIQQILKDKGFDQVPQFEVSSEDRGAKPIFIK